MPHATYQETPIRIDSPQGTAWGVMCAPAHGMQSAHLGVVFVSVTVMISTFGTLNAVLFTSPRIFFAMSQDGLLPKIFGKVHPKFHTPYVGTIFVATYSIKEIAILDCYLTHKSAIERFPNEVLSSAREIPELVPRSIKHLVITTQQ